MRPHHIRTFLLGFVTLVGTSQNSCKTSGPRGSDTKGYVSEGSSYLWPRGVDGKISIPVCWENPETSSDKVRDSIASLVTFEYGQAGLDFVGWKTCNEDSLGIRIFNNDTRQRRVEAFGAKISGIKNGMLLNLNWEVTPTFCAKEHKDVCILNDALHEFGHAIGLRHEANRTDSLCVEAQRPGTGEQGALEVGEFDKDSIMNYCANTMVWKTGQLQRLSAMDREVIRRYYSGEVNFKNKEACEKEGHSWIERFTESCCRVSSEAINLSEQKAYNYCGVVASVKLSDSLRGVTSNILESEKFTVIIDCPGLFPPPTAVVERNQLLAEFPITFRPKSGVLCSDVLVVPGVKREETKNQQVLRLKQNEPRPLAVDRIVFDGIFKAESAAESKLPTDVLTSRFYSKHKFTIKLPKSWSPRSAMMACDKQDLYTTNISDDAIEFTIASLGFQLQQEINCTGIKIFDAPATADASKVYSMRFEKTITMPLGRNSNQNDLSSFAVIESRLK
ncbi:MAG: hypothetical protein FJ146_09750 [Deltaproteobacteria bacterium]|nr:hypothetical protein [Deltaproteobacteria bacterium]